MKLIKQTVEEFDFRGINFRKVFLTIGSATIAVTYLNNINHGMEIKAGPFQAFYMPYIIHGGRFDIYWGSRVIRLFRPETWVVTNETD